MSKGEKTDLKDQIVASIKNFSLHARGDVVRSPKFEELSTFVRKKAALMSAHILLPAGARVVDMACGKGDVTYAFALLNPRCGVIGFDRDPEVIAHARKHFRLPNLTFEISDVTSPDLENESVDAIVNSNVLHHVYSEGGYNVDEVTRILEKQTSKLKPGGTMLIRDYMLPSDNELVLLELPKVESRGTDPKDLSDADLLVRFSQTARPLSEDQCEGFFIEEQTPKREGTRLFRLPHKWALEFVHRKNHRKKWEQELKSEYTFYNYKDYRRVFARFGLRMVFSAPYWNPWVVKNSFKGRFQMYTEAGVKLDQPATNYFIVAQKVSDKQSLIMEERRPSQKPVGDLQIMVVRDKKTGEVHELVKRPGEYCDIIPYRITPDNRLVIYVRSGSPRPIVNAVSRGSHNLDGKRWSGHLIEPLTMNTEKIGEDVEENRKSIFSYMSNCTSLRSKSDSSWFVGQTYYPSPDRIDEAIEPVFIEVENPQKTNWPLAEGELGAFTEPGTITELDGAEIILASQVGLLPEPRLEMHVLALMAQHNIQLPSWIGDEMPAIPAQKLKVHDPEDVMDEVEKTSFEPEKKGAVYLKPVKSVFVEEGKSGRNTRGLAAHDVEFILTEDGIENIAVVLPVSRDWDDNLLVALEPKIMPVPNRMGDDGPQLNAPSFLLPKDVKTIDDAKQFVADKFKVPLDHVASLGESYFTHTGVTPQRIYPFMVSAGASPGAGRPLQFMMTKRLFKLGLFFRQGLVTMKLMMRMQMMTDANNDMSMNREIAAHQKVSTFSLSTDKQVVQSKNGGYAGVPSKILGQRGAAIKPDISVVVSNSTVEQLSKSVPRLAESYSQAKKPTPEMKRPVK